MTAERNISARVSFVPDKASVVVEKGTTLLEACHHAGIEIDAVCGGEGKCGRCKVKVDGKVDFEGSPLVGSGEEGEGVVLACLARIAADLSVEVLPRSRLGRHQILTKSIEEIPKPLSPWTSKKFLELPPATIGDNIADAERLLRTLREAHVAVPLDTLRELPRAVRDEDWKVTVTLTAQAGAREITRVEPGNTADRLLGVAVDIGTTTVVANLLDLNSGRILGTASDYNKQISKGEDVIARMMYAEEKGPEELTTLVRETINSCIQRLLEEERKHSGCHTDERDIVAASIAGNTVMTHLFLGLDTRNVRFEPYVPVAHHMPMSTGSDLGLDLNRAARAFLFPSRAGYVGGDVIADVVASGMHRSKTLSLLIDVGTNGEIVLGGRDWLVACSCSAGPAFEGGEVSSGMRAMEGAIDRLRINEDLTSTYHVLGEVPPAGICGSGLIDLVAELYERGVIDRKARIQELESDMIRPSDSGHEFVVERRDRLAPGHSADLVVTDADLQNLLRTKAAIHGACSVLLRKTGQSLDNLSHVVIAGGFGYHLDIDRAISIGMFPDVPRKKYKFIGNGALGGAMLALLSERRRKEVFAIFDRMTYFELSVDNEFYDEFSSSLFIPHTDLSRFPSVKGQTAGKEAG